MRYLALAPWVNITHELRAVAKDTHLEKASNTLPSREGFTITEEALISLVSNNGQLERITLPGETVNVTAAYDVGGPYRRHHGVSAGESRGAGHCR